MKRRAHIIRTTDGRYLIEPCGSRGRKLLAWKPRHGETLKPGQSMVHVTPRDDGHFDYEITHRERRKPAQVATPAFRRGWVTAFAGDKSVN